MKPPPSAIAALLAGRHDDPFSLLGVYAGPTGTFARALIRNPDLVIMDEPSMGLAPVLVSRVFEIIRTIRDRGTAVFVVEQNARAVLQVADYAYVLAAGQVVLEGTPDAVADAPMMTEAYLGKRS